MSELTWELSALPELTELRARTRSLIEEAPEEGMRTIEDGRFIADVLWNEWSEQLQSAGMCFDRFLSAVRSYRGEVRLWVMGERPWAHCVAGLAGRVVRRIPDRAVAIPANADDHTYDDDFQLGATG